MDINKIKYILVGGCVEPVISDDELLNEFDLNERIKIYGKCAYYEKLIQDIKNEKKDWIFEYCDYNLGIINDVYTNAKKIHDSERYVTTRDNLVNNFVNCSYDLEIISKTFNDVTKTTNIKTIEYYAIDTRTNEYYDIYDIISPKKRYFNHELRKMVKEKIDSANNYEFDASYLTYGDKRVILTLYV